MSSAGPLANLSGKGPEGRKGSSKYAVPDPFRVATFVQFEGVHSPRSRGRAPSGADAPAVDDPEALFVHAWSGREVVEVDGTRRGTVVAVQANPASDLLVLEDGSLVPLTFVVGREEDHLVVARAVRLNGLFDPPDGPQTSAAALRIDVFSIFPEAVDTYLMTSVVGRARREGRLDLRAHDLRGRRQTPTAALTMLLSGAGRAWCSLPRPSSGQSSSSTRLARVPAVAFWAAFRPGRGDGAGGHHGRREAR